MSDPANAFTQNNASPLPPARRRSKAHSQVRLSIGSPASRIPSGNVVDLKAVKSSILAAQQAFEQPKSHRWGWLARLFTRDTTNEETDAATTPTVSDQREMLSTPASDFFITYDDAIQSEDTIPKDRRIIPSPVLLRPLATFALVGVLVISPIWFYATLSDADTAKQEVLGVSQDALQHFTNASVSLSGLNASGARQEFGSALEKLEEAKRIIERFGLLGKIVPNSKVSSGKHLLSASEHIARIGTSLSEIVDTMSHGSSNAVSLLSSIQEQLSPLEQELRAARVELEQVDVNDVPPSHRESIEQLQTIIPELEIEMRSIRETMNALLPLLGSDGEKRYLVLFQNSAERRATGGFIGSFATLTIANGRVEMLDVPEGGTYDVSGQQHTVVAPPKPLSLVADSWELQDVNWSPDFPWTARKAQLMYQDGGGESTDGVIALDTEVLRQLLSVIGEVQIPDKDITVTAETVSDVLMREIAEVRDTRTPKAMIASLVPEILNRALTLSADQTLSMMAILDRLMVEKHLLVYSRDDALQQQFVNLGWAGELRSTSGDYVQVNFSNIAGGKTDEHIDTLIDLEAVIGGDGVITDHLTITRTHKGDPEDTLYGIDNTTYVRVYVPEGAEFISANGFVTLDPRKFLYPKEGATADPDLATLEGKTWIDGVSGTSISTEMSKTVFGNWMETRVGETSRVELVYSWKPEVPEDSKRTTPYSLYVQKQSGDSKTVFSTRATDEAHRSVIWNYPQDLTASSGMIWDEQVVLTTDQLFAVLLKNR